MRIACGWPSTFSNRGFWAKKLLGTSLLLVVRPGAPSSVLAPFVAMRFAPFVASSTPLGVEELIFRSLRDDIRPHQLFWKTAWAWLKGRPVQLILHSTMPAMYYLFYAIVLYRIVVYAIVLYRIRLNWTTLSDSIALYALHHWLYYSTPLNVSLCDSLLYRIRLNWVLFYNIILYHIACIVIIPFGKPLDMLHIWGSATFIRQCRMLTICYFLCAFVSIMHIHMV